MKILELGGPLDNQVVTEMSHGFPGVEKYFVDAFEEIPNFSITPALGIIFLHFLHKCKIFFSLRVLKINAKISVEKKC